ncbi:hypothetical protein FZC35_00995 [Candidatus Cytomitobacter indipagum]|uniref:Gcp-like domain-containing protein n=1 Tax=Candidatus Cytomitobacter indipagum TaxID=2601575 RepID=A0A5C0UDA1_9PROT|nr:hypothetical protein [Candidatus Cytomitobacter indipagum]QEK37958.1 hypothetical protein FZC35_00995 [Candidatus Cytomitobacter indipagum]
MNIFFIQREFFIELWHGSDFTGKMHVKTPSNNLLECIGILLKRHDLSMNDLSHFNSISGPGSFSSIRIAYSTLSALKRVFLHINFSSHNMEDLLDNPKNLLIRLNRNIFLVFDNKWEVKFRKELDIDQEYKMIYEKEMNLIDDLNDMKIELIQNAGKLMNSINENHANCIKEPLYIYMPV